MPSRIDKLSINKINPKLDKRRKLTLKDKKHIIVLHREGIAIREITRIYNVSRRLIQFIIFPERQENNLQDKADRGGWSQYYEKDKHKNYMKVHRAYKKEVLL